MDSIFNPSSLAESENAAFREETRTFNQEKFEALQERYQTIDGVIQIGITTEEGRVLLLGPDEWAPPGGDVEPGEDWVAAARRVTKELMDVTIVIEDVELVEHTIFQLRREEESQFTTYVAHFRASIAENNREFIENPTIADDLNHKYFDNKSNLSLEWFDKIPENAHENHKDHIQLYLN